MIKRGNPASRYGWQTKHVVLQIHFESSASWCAGYMGWSSPLKKQRLFAYYPSFSLGQWPLHCPSDLLWCRAPKDRRGVILQTPTHLKSWEHILAILLPKFFNAVPQKQWKSHQVSGGGHVKCLWKCYCAWHSDHTSGFGFWNKLTCLTRLIPGPWLSIYWFI